MPGGRRITEIAWILAAAEDQMNLRADTPRDALYVVRTSSQEDMIMYGIEIIEEGAEPVRVKDGFSEIWMAESWAGSYAKRAVRPGKVYVMSPTKGLRCIGYSYNGAGDAKVIPLEDMMAD